MSERWALLLLVAGACAGPDSAFVDLRGEPHSPLRVDDGAAHVLLFTTVDCPIANGYAPAIQGLADEFEPRGVRFFLVHVDPDVGRDRAREHAADFGYELPVLLDGEQRLVDRLGVTVTPEAAVLSPAGDLVYRGRIDNWYAALGEKRRQPTTADLRDALEAVLAGREVAVARTRAIGCLVPD